MKVTYLQRSFFNVVFVRWSFTGRSTSAAL